MQVLRGRSRRADSRLLGAMLIVTCWGCVPRIPADAISPDRLSTGDTDTGSDSVEQPGESRNGGEVIFDPVVPDAAFDAAFRPDLSIADVATVTTDVSTATADVAPPVKDAAAAPDQNTADLAAPPLDVALAPPTRPADLMRDRVGHWRLDEQGGTGAVDSGPIGNHGATIGLSDEDWRPAKVHNGLTFKPQSRSLVVVGAHESLSPAKALSISIWVNARSWQGQPCLLEKGASGEEYGLGIRANQLHFVVRLSAGQTVRASAPLPPLDEWVHVAAIYDGNAAFIFVRGVQVAATSSPGQPAVARNDLTFGGRRSASAPNGDFFAGMLDEVLLYARALSAEEVRLLAAGNGP